MIIELLNDDTVIGKLKKALYPQALSDKIDSQTAQIDRLLAQLTDSKTRIDQLESRVSELEDQAYHTEQYTLRANPIFTGMTETGSGENVEATMLAVINYKIASTVANSVSQRESSIVIRCIAAACCDQE